MMPFSEMPGDYPKEARDRVMHSRITKGDAVLLMASDTMPGHGFTLGTNFSVSVHCESQEEIDRLFAAFSEKAKKITMPLQDAFWGARFGMLTDQFGVNWMFNFEKPKQ
jgi:PhnB protein